LAIRLYQHHLPGKDMKGESMTVSVRCISTMIHGQGKVLALLRNSLLSIGLILALTSAQASTGEPAGASAEAAAASASAPPDASDQAPATPAAAGNAAAPTTLSPRMQAALDYVKARYKVSREAMQPLFETVQWIARERGLDPLLIVAVIGIESGFNAKAKSAGGGHGLMQIIPRFHLDKIPGGQGAKALMDPEINVKVGARILDDAIRQAGNTMAGLQSYNGSDRKGLFARRVLAERARLEGGAP
jgi:soluble lytic murein transglycosylase-like protein